MVGISTKLRNLPAVPNTRSQRYHISEQKSPLPECLPLAESVACRSRTCQGNVNESGWHASKLLMVAFFCWPVFQVCVLSHRAVFPLKIAWTLEQGIFPLYPRPIANRGREQEEAREYHATLANIHPAQEYWYFFGAQSCVVVPILLLGHFAGKTQIHHASA